MIFFVDIQIKVQRICYNFNLALHSPFRGSHASLAVASIKLAAPVCERHGNCGEEYILKTPDTVS